MRSLIQPPERCLPWWHTQFMAIAGRGDRVIRSGCATSGGNVQCDPEAMRAKAQATLQAAGYNIPLSLASYTLARYIASEVGSGTPEEKVAVAEAAINRVRLEKLRDVNALLLYRQASGHPNRGRYGPIHHTADDGSRTSPYGRWAATSQDPSVQDVAITSFVLAGDSDDFALGADDQDGPEGLNNPVNKVKAQALRRDYWVGPLPGVDHWHTFLYRYLPEVDPHSDLGTWLTDRGIAALSNKTRPSWAGYPVCGKPLSIGGLLLLAATGAGGYYGYRWWQRRRTGYAPAR